MANVERAVKDIRANGIRDDLPEVFVIAKDVVPTGGGRQPATRLQFAVKLLFPK